MSSHKLILLPLLLLLIPQQSLGDCTCDLSKDEGNKAEALRYKIVAIVSILVAGAVGVCLPLLGKIIPALSPQKDIFFLIKAFAAGVILATGFVHILPDAFDNLTSPCLSENPWANFPFAGFVAMVSGIGTLMVDTYANSYYSNSQNHHVTSGTVGPVGSADEEKTDGHVHSHVHSPLAFLGESDSDPSNQLLRNRVISQVLELGIVAHSVIIGISLGASESPKTIRPLVAALTFHQFFEGMGLGGTITQAKFKSRVVAAMAVFFSLTTPIGIGIGIGITNVYEENSPTALIVDGLFNAASSGILIYMALVDLLSADFMSPKLQTNPMLLLGANFFLLFGAGCMSLLAKWA